MLYDDKIGQRIQSLRKSKGYTQDTLAEKAGISSRFLNDVERGKKGMSSTTLAELAIALRTSADYLLFGNEKDSSGIEEAIARLDENEQKQISQLLQTAINIIDTTSKKKSD